MGTATAMTVKIKFIGKVEVNHQAVPEATVEEITGFSILEICQNHGIELPHNCGGVCACSTCHVKIREGADLCNPISEKEEDQLDDADNVEPDSRLGCQTRIEKEGELVIEIPPFYGITHEH